MGLPKENLLSVGMRIYKKFSYTHEITEILVIERVTKTMAFTKNDAYKFKIKFFGDFVSLVSKEKYNSFFYVLETEPQK